jgi:hypothetical protein
VFTFRTLFRPVANLNVSANIVAHTESRLGWNPKWKTNEFVAHIGDEVDAVVELGKAKSSLLESLRLAAQG